MDVEIKYEKRDSDRMAGSFSNQRIVASTKFGFRIGNIFVFRDGILARLPLFLGGRTVYPQLLK